MSEDLAMSTAQIIGGLVMYGAVVWLAYKDHRECREARVKCRRS